MGQRSISVPADMHDRIKAYCTEQGVTLRQFLDDLLADLPPKTESTATIASWQIETFGAAKTTLDRVYRSYEMIKDAFTDTIASVSFDPYLTRPNLSRAIRAAEELAELIEVLLKNDDDPKACMEVADIKIVLEGIPAAHGRNSSDLVDAKMRINRARRWSRTGDGHGQHK